MDARLREAPLVPARRVHRGAAVALPDVLAACERHCGRDGDGRLRVGVPGAVRARDRSQVHRTKVCVTLCVTLSVCTFIGRVCCGCHLTESS